MEADSVEALHAGLRWALQRLPRASALPRPQCYGPAAGDVEAFIARLRGLPPDAWWYAEEYHHNLERNRYVRDQLVRTYPVLLDLAAACGRRPALRAAAEDALQTLPPQSRAEWEAATILYAWALVLQDLLPPDRRDLLTRPLTVLAPQGGAAGPAPVVSPAPVGQAPDAPAPRTPQPAPAPPLPSFADVGGLETVKTGLRQAIGDALRHPEQAAQLRVRACGILLHGPPGNGKSFLARATAGEFGLHFQAVSGAALGGHGTGDAERSLREAFASAERRLPCLLFIDDVDSVAPRAGDGGARSTRAALVECMRRAMQTTGLVVMAATDALETLDDTILREGVFDITIHVHDPDPSARRRILENQLLGRSDLSRRDIDELVRRTDGRSSGFIASLVNRAAQHALHRVSLEAGATTITRQDVRAALRDRMGVVGVRQERHLRWDDLVLPAQTRERLVVLQKLVEEPGRARALGISRIPRGAILYGPPRTGKTSIARVLASQTSCSFFAIGGSEIKSKWVGETERKIRDLFREAREARPAMVFIDEIDAIAAARGELSDPASRAHDSALNQLLTELDGFQAAEGVLVIGATNRFDLLDPAIVAGGRLSEHIEVPLPDRADRLRLLQLYTRRMPLEPAADLGDLAASTEGLAGDDIESLCSRAAMRAFGRDSRVVTREDLDAAAVEAAAARGRGWRDG